MEYAYRATGADAAFDPAGHVLEAAALTAAANTSAGAATPPQAAEEEEEKNEAGAAESRTRDGEASDGCEEGVEGREGRRGGLDRAGGLRIRTPVESGRARRRGSGGASIKPTPFDSAGLLAAMGTPIVTGGALSRRVARRGSGTSVDSAAAAAMAVYGGQPGMLAHVLAGQATPAVAGASHGDEDEEGKGEGGGQRSARSRDARPPRRRPSSGVDVQAVAPESLPRLMGVLESRAAGITLAYAAHATAEAELAAREAAAAAQAADALTALGPQPASAPAGVFVLGGVSAGPSLFGDGEGGGGGEGGRGSASEVVVGAASALTAGAAAYPPPPGSASRSRRVTQARELAAEKEAASTAAHATLTAALAALGPSAPSGRARVSLAASTLITAILGDPASLAMQALEGAGGDKEGAGATWPAAGGVHRGGGRRGSAATAATTASGHSGSHHRARGGALTASASGARPRLGSVATLDAGGSHGEPEEGTVGGAGSSGGGEEGAEGDDEACRPLSIAELRAQASGLANGPAFKAVRAAAKVAATVLASRVQQQQQVQAAALPR